MNLFDEIMGYWLNNGNILNNKNLFLLSSGSLFDLFGELESINANANLN